MDKVTVSLKADDTAVKSSVKVVVEMTNNTDQDLVISRDAIMLDGFRSDKFNIYPESDPSQEIVYIGREVKYRPADIVLEAHKSLSVTLDLTTAYDFASAEDGMYVVSFHTSFILCHDTDKTTCSGMTQDAYASIEITH